MVATRSILTTYLYGRTKTGKRRKSPRASILRSYNVGLIAKTSTKKAVKKKAKKKAPKKVVSQALLGQKKQAKKPAKAAKVKKEKKDVLIAVPTKTTTKKKAAAPKKGKVVKLTKKQLEAEYQRGVGESYLRQQQQRESGVAPSVKREAPKPLPKRGIREISILPPGPYTSKHTGHTEADIKQWARPITITKPIPKTPYTKKSRLPEYPRSGSGTTFTPTKLEPELSYQYTTPRSEAYWQSPD
jgi:hypothetical protein